MSKTHEFWRLGCSVRFSSPVHLQDTFFSMRSHLGGICSVQCLSKLFASICVYMRINYLSSIAHMSRAYFVVMSLVRLVLQERKLDAKNLHA